MKILLLGGTGAMGLHLTKILSEQGNEIFVTTRQKRENMEFVHYIQGNAHDVSFLYSLLHTEWDAIISSAMTSLCWDALTVKITISACLTCAPGLIRR